MRALISTFAHLTSLKRRQYLSAALPSFSKHFQRHWLTWFPHWPTCTNTVDIFQFWRLWRLSQELPLLRWWSGAPLNRGRLCTMMHFVNKWRHAKFFYENAKYSQEDAVTSSSSVMAGAGVTRVISRCEEAKENGKLGTVSRAVQNNQQNESIENRLHIFQMKHLCQK